MNKTDILTIREFALRYVAASFPKSAYRQAAGSLLATSPEAIVTQRGRWEPRGGTPETVAEQLAAHTVRLTYAHPEGMHLPSRENDIWSPEQYAQEKRRHDLAKALQQDTETRLRTQASKLCDLLDIPHPAWLGKLSVASDAPDATQPPSKKESSPTSRVYWRSLLSEHYPKMRERYGKTPSIGQALNYLKELNDPRITIQTSGEKAVIWETDDQIEVEVKRDTVSNALSELRRQRKPKS